MKKIFFSYAPEVSEVAQQLRETLSDAEVSGWMDSADIASGRAIGQKIRESITAASDIVVLVSPRSVNDQWVQFEVGAAWALEAGGEYRIDSVLLTAAYRCSHAYVHASRFPLSLLSLKTIFFRMKVESL